MSEEKENGKTKQCKYCKQEIDAKAKICPHCRKKQKPSGCLIAVIAVVVIVVIAIAGSAMSGGEKTNSGAPANGANSTSAAQQEITYTAYSVSELMDDLNTNAMNASDKYKDQYVELTGKLSVIDSNGKYISILPTDDEFAIIGVQCYFQSDEQKSAVKSAAIGDTLVVKGKITDVGEVMGYSLNMDEVTKAQ